MKARHPLHVASALVLGLALSACQGLEHVEECRAVARLVNPVLTGVKQKQSQSPASSSTYRAIALEYERAAGASTLLKVRTKRVSEALGDYQRVLREAARDARVFSDALDSKDEGRIAAARAAAARTVRHEGGALSRMESVCRPR